MSFFDMGPLEILLILAVALIVFGPEKIPEMARTLGRIVRAFRKATYDITQSVTKELEKEEKDIGSQSKEGKSEPVKQPPSADKTESSSQETTNPKEQ